MPFEKGQSGNPGGRPKVVAEVKELAREHTGEAIKTLVSIMTNPKSAPAARVSAANALLDRGYGKPPQHITGEGGPAYVVRLPEPCKTAEEWVASLGRSTRSPYNRAASRPALPTCDAKPPKLGQTRLLKSPVHTSLGLDYIGGSWAQA